MTEFRSIEDQIKIMNVDELRKRREPEKTDKRISNLIKTISTNKRHNTEIVYEDDFEYFQWFSRKKATEDKQKQVDDRVITEKFNVSLKEAEKHA